MSPRGDHPWGRPAGTICPGGMPRGKAAPGGPRGDCLLVAYAWAGERPTMRKPLT